MCQWGTTWKNILMTVVNLAGKKYPSEWIVKFYIRLMMVCFQQISRKGWDGLFCCFDVWYFSSLSYIQICAYTVLKACFCPSTRGKSLKHKSKLHLLPQKQVLLSPFWTQITYWAEFRTNWRISDYWRHICGSWKTLWRKITKTLPCLQNIASVFSVGLEKWFCSDNSSASVGYDARGSFPIGLKYWSIIAI